MSDVRRTVLTALEEQSSSSGETTTVTALADAVGLPEQCVDEEVEGLVDCDLSAESGDGIRVTVTGGELLELDVEGPVVVDPGG